MSNIIDFLIEFLGFVKFLINDPLMISIVGAIVIMFYYLVSWGFIESTKKHSPSRIWRKNGFLDWFTSVVWVLFSILLIISLFELSGRGELDLKFLILYYFLFIFLFGILYGILAWHYSEEKMFDGLYPISWRAEIQYIIISIQTQTTLGYTRARPNSLIAEIIACLQALLGLFFCIVFISKAVA